MFKFILNIFNKSKGAAVKYIQPIIDKTNGTVDKILPKFVKNEIKTMKSGVANLSGRFHDNYFIARKAPELRGMTRLNALHRSLGPALVKTSITKQDIPSLFAIAGGCSCPLPGTTEAGYIVGRLLTSKPAGKIYSAGKNVYHSTYSTFNNILTRTG